MPTNIKKILIVDDDPHIRKILERMLSQAPYETKSAEDGIQALKILETFKPHLVILDLMMPGLSGTQVCQKIREKFDEDEIQILMLSAKDSEKDRHSAFETGANDYLTKPFHIASLAQKIELSLQKPINKKSKPHQ